MPITIRTPRGPKRSTAALAIGMTASCIRLAAQNDAPYRLMSPRSSSTAGITVATVRKCSANSVSRTSSPTISRPCEPRNTSRQRGGAAGAAADMALSPPPPRSCVDPGRVQSGVAVEVLPRPVGVDERPRDADPGEPRGDVGERGGDRRGGGPLVPGLHRDHDRVVADHGREPGGVERPQARGVADRDVEPLARAERGPEHRPERHHGGPRAPRDDLEPSRCARRTVPGSSRRRGGGTSDRSPA